jgi:hypothetical protein
MIPCYSRLLVRLAGLFTLAASAVFIDKMLRVEPYKNREAAIAQNTHRAVKVVKKLGQGGAMHAFLNYVQPFTRSVRILVATWRWTESAQCRRDEVGAEEFMVRATGVVCLGSCLLRMSANLLSGALLS